jgi:hypothetical protein
MSSRYIDDRDYRQSDSRRRERDRDSRDRPEPTRDQRRRIDETREPRRESQIPEPMDISMDRRGDPRMDSRRGIDPSMDRMDISREPPRANTTSRIDRGQDRMIDRGAEPEEKYVRDPQTGQLYRQVPTSRTAAYPPRGSDREYIDGPPASRSRTHIDTEMKTSREEPRSAVTEYWCSGDGIEREV